MASSSLYIDGFVCPCVCAFVCVCNAFLPCSYHWIFMKLSTDIDLMKCFWHVPFQVKRSRSQRSCEIFVVSTPWLLAYLIDLLYAWHKYSPWRDDVPQSISRSKGQRSRSHRSFDMKATLVIRSFSCVRSVAPSLFGWITSYVAYIQHMMDDMLGTIFRIKGQAHPGHVNFLPCPLCSSVSISPIHFIWDTHNPWGHNVSRTFSRSKGQGHLGNLIFFVSTLLLPPYLTKSLHIWTWEAICCAQL